MTVTRIQPPIELETTRGRARAHFLLDYGTDTSLVWVCFVRDTGECWCVRNEDVRESRDDTWSLPGGLPPRRAVEPAGGPQGAAGSGVAAAPLGAAGDPSQPAAGGGQPADPTPPRGYPRVEYDSITYPDWPGGGR